MMCYTITIKDLRKRGIIMPQKIRSGNTTLIAIRMNNELFDEMEELRAILDATRTEFIEWAVAVYMSLLEDEEDII